MPGGFRRKRARDEQRVRVDGNGLMSGMIGEAGLAEADLTAIGHELDARAEAFERQRRIGFGAPPIAKTDLRKTIQLAEQIRGAFADVVVFGSGSLALGILALAEALPPSTDAEDASSPVRLHVIDGLDTDGFADLLAQLDLPRTLFAVMDGRDDTLATMTHFVIVRDRLLRELGAVEYQRHVVIATDPNDGPLRQIVNDEGFCDLPLALGCEDAFTPLTAAALFPLACVGHDVAAIVAGAADMAERCRARGDDGNPARLFATALLRGSTLGPKVVAASARARTLASWLERRCTGIAADASTPHPALTIVLAVTPSADDLTLPAAYQDLEHVGYLSGQSLTALGEHARTAVEMASWSAGQPTLTLACPDLGPHALGQLLQLVESASALARGTDGPTSTVAATAERLTFALAGRPGSEAERAEVQRLATKREARYVV